MKIRFIAIMVGIGWIISKFSEIWKLIVYLIPAISFILLVLCGRALIKTVKGDDGGS